MNRDELVNCMAYISVFSVGYTMDHIVYKWLDKPVQFESTIQLPQFSMINVTLTDCSQNYTTGELKMLFYISFY